MLVYKPKQNSIQNNALA